MPASNSRLGIVLGAVVIGLFAPIATSLAEPLRYAEDRAPGIVNPLFSTTMSEARIDELVFDGLFSDDQDLRSTPSLAESVELAADKKSCIVRLRSGVTWHDGKPFTSKDVIFTIDAMRNKTTASTEAGRVGWIKTATAPDAQTVKLDFHGEEWAPEDKLHFKILPAHKFTSAAVKRTDPFRSQPIGTGPFKVASFNDDNSITLEKNIDAREPAQLEALSMREVSDKNYQAKLLIYESLEALVRVLPRDLATLQSDKKVELYPYQTNSWWYVGFNNGRGALANPKVRKAISHMVNVPELLAPIGTGDLVSGPFVPSSPFYNHDVAQPAPDPELAKSLLTEAGYTWSGRQWEMNGQPLKVRLATVENLETAQDVVINLQSQLQNQGVVVEPSFLGTADWKEKVWRDQDFDLILSQWSFDRNEDIYEQFHSKGTRNFVRYVNPEVDKLLDDARNTADPQQKKALMRQVHVLVAGDNPMIFLWTLDSYSALSAKVQNVVVHPFYFFTWADRWSMQ